MFTIEELLSWTKGKLLQGENMPLTASLNGISTDTRTLEKGMAFLALSGERFDGHDFLKQAAQKGVAVLIVDDNRLDEISLPPVTIIAVSDTLAAYLAIAGAWRQKFSLPVVAITGSNGKTTTKDLTAAVLEQKYVICKTFKNYNSEIGLAQTLLSLRPTAQVAVVEMGMRGLGQIEALCKAACPDVGAVINVGEAHMELLGSKKNIARAKGELIASLSRNGLAVLNGDDPFVSAMRDISLAPCMTFGIKNKADVMAENIHVTTEGKTTFDCLCPEGKFACEIPLIGEHNVYDALAAICIGIHLGVEIKNIVQGLAAFKSSGMRFELKPWRDYFFINDAYNASPSSVRSSLEAMQKVARSRRIFAFGDMKELGAAELKAHQEVGEFCAAQKIDALFTFGTLAAAAAEAAQANGVKAFAFDNQRELAKRLGDFLKPGDTVLFKGSHSMHMEKIIELLENLN